MKIIALRHEKTDYNVENKVQGLTDIPLNEMGIESCKKLRSELEDFDIDYVISSPLKRARQTAMLVSDAPLFLDDRLIERNLGFYEGKDKSLYDSCFYADYDLNSTQNGVESVRDVLERVFDFLDEITKNNDKTILLVSHGGIIKYIPYYFSGLPKHGILNAYTIKNGEYFVLER